MGYTESAGSPASGSFGTLVWALLIGGVVLYGLYLAVFAGSNKPGKGILNDLRVSAGITPAAPDQPTAPEGALPEQVSNGSDFAAERETLVESFDMSLFDEAETDDL